MSGFLLLPIKQDILHGRFACWDDRELSVFVVLVAHMNSRSRKAIPGQDRISILAKVRKADIGDIVRKLSARGLVSSEFINTKLGRVRAEYTMRYDAFRTKDERRRDGVGQGELKRDNWLRLDSYVVMGGIWAEMMPSARKLYLVLIALSVGGYGAEYASRSVLHMGNDLLEEGRFVDARYLVDSKLKALSGLKDRTFRRAWDSLYRLGLVETVQEDTRIGRKVGLLLVSNPDASCPSVMARVKMAKAQSERPPQSVLNKLAKGAALSPRGQP